MGHGVDFKTSARNVGKLQPAKFAAIAERLRTVNAFRATVINQIPTYTNENRPLAVVLSVEVFRIVPGEISGF